MKKLAVVALGGNALLRENQRGTIDEQEQNVYDACVHLMELIKSGYNIIISHGNGPQIGNALLRHEAGFNVYKISKMPIDFCVAETQGSIGFMIEQQMKNVLAKENIERDVVAIITRVLVDKNDPAFDNPTKPVGPFYQKEEADKLACENGWIFKEDSRRRGWRRVVASPKPEKIINIESIKSLIQENKIVITVGGGGIPVFYVEPKKLQGIDAVIDKDLASSLLASQIGADKLFILTDVPKVCLNFNTPEEKKLYKITVPEAEKYLSEGHFAEGSMAPKICAATQFVKNGGKETIITEASRLGGDDCGTRIMA